MNKKRKRAEHTLYITLLPLMIFVIIIAILEMFLPEFRLLTASIAIVTLGVFFAKENPADVYKERAFTDLDTGVKNKNCYE